MWFVEGHSNMALAKNLVFLFLCHLLLPKADANCQPSFQCGNWSMKFPFSNIKDPGCGLVQVDGCDSEHPEILSIFGRTGYRILNMTPPNKLRILDPDLPNQLKSRDCLFYKYVHEPDFPSISFRFSPNLTLFTCSNQTYSKPIEEHFQNYNHTKCGISTVYYKTLATAVPATEESRIPQGCLKFQLPIKSPKNSSDLFNLLTAEFSVEWNVSEACSRCYHRGGQCLANTGSQFKCKEKGNGPRKLILGICGGVPLLLICLLVAYIVWLRKKRINGRYLLSRNISSNPSSKSDIEEGRFYFGIPVFSYTELEEVTNKFDPSKKLGDGGFGTVYYAKLQDGREVAIKRLYEHNYRREQQFLNEIKILTGLRHPNLVSLYGCTSRRSRELLLVYEYISNGTVADHLHGERAKEAPLTWPIRMNIAIETATALAYLHKSDIIHRDVKTNNILLDNKFCVKVADFGLSKLFPYDVTHISTAPQGTPGYVDPEYHQCYQLTDKSDVYSFGVVLIELISTMPAVDMSRHRQEVNLANLAVNRIQRCAFDELIDPSLGYDCDPEVTRMTTSVAELAFLCLQLDRDMRPCMEEVLAFLKDIHGGEDCDFEQIKGANGSYSVPENIPSSPETDEVVLLTNKNLQYSPTSVTARWASSGSTTASFTG